MQNEFKIRQALKMLDLSELEVTVYLHLLQIGNTPASVLARRLNYNRSTTRYTLENLRKKKLIIQADQNGTFYFSAENPEKILLICREEKTKIERKESVLSQVVGDLKNLQNPYAQIPKVQFFEGVDGVKNIYMDVIREGKTIFGYSRVDEVNVHPEILEFLRNEYTPARIECGNKAFMLYNDIHSDEYLRKDKALNRVTLRIPSNVVEFHSCFHIYGNKVAFYSRTESDLTGILIENDIIRRDQFSLFKMAWNHVKSFPQNKPYKNITLDDLFFGKE